MNEVDTLCEHLESMRPVGWDDLPDIELYRDQVINYMPRQQILQKESDYLTGAMVNNYIKNNMLPRANGKKYNKEHIAYLTAICILKQVLSVNDTDQLIKLILGDGTAEDFYKTFCSCFGANISHAGEFLRHKKDECDLSELAMQFALAAYANKMICQSLLQILRDSQPCGNLPKANEEKEHSSTK